MAENGGPDGDDRNPDHQWQLVNLVLAGGESDRAVTIGDEAVRSIQQENKIVSFVTRM